MDQEARKPGEPKKILVRWEEILEVDDVSIDG